MAPSVTAVVCPKQILQQSVPEAERCWCYGSAARLRAGTSHGLFYLSFPLIKLLIKHFSTLFIFLVVPVKVCIRWRQLFPHHPQSRGKRIRKEWGSVQSTRMLHCHLHGMLPVAWLHLEANVAAAKWPGTRAVGCPFETRKGTTGPLWKVLQRARARRTQWHSCAL